MSEGAQLVLGIYGWVASGQQWKFLTPKRVKKLLRPIFGQDVLDEVDQFLKEKGCNGQET